MPIEFRCHQCQRLLRTADDTGGKQTKCPECFTILDIPLPAAATSAPPPESPSAMRYGRPVSMETPANSFASHTHAAAGSGNPYASPHSPSSPSPFAAAPRVFTPMPIDVGEVLNHAWTIFSNNLLQLVAGALILFGVVVAMLVPVLLVIGVGVGLGAAVADDGNEEVGAVFIVLSVLTGIAILFGVGCWLQAGVFGWVLKIVRGEPATFTDIFRGGRYCLRALGAGLLFALASILGYLLCIVPGVIISLIFSQFLWLILDRDAGAIESLGLSSRLTEGSRLSLFLLMLLIMAVGMVANMIPGAFLLTTPFTWVLFAVAYLRMSGQTTADMLTPLPVA